MQFQPHKNLLLLISILEPAVQVGILFQRVCVCGEKEKVKERKRWHTVCVFIALLYCICWSNNLFCQVMSKILFNLLILYHLIYWKQHISAHLFSPL